MLYMMQWNKGLITAYKKNYNSKTNVKVVIDKKTGEFKSNALLRSCS